MDRTGGQVILFNNLIHDTGQRENSVMLEGLAAATKIQERRSKPRISVPFHARVKGTDLSGNEFLVETVLDNIGADGLYMRIVPRVGIGARLCIDVGLHTTSHVTDNSPRFSVDGNVLRTDEKLGGACGVAVAFAKVRFD